MIKKCLLVFISLSIVSINFISLDGGLMARADEVLSKAASKLGELHGEQLASGELWSSKTGETEIGQTSESAESFSQKNPIEQLMVLIATSIDEDKQTPEYDNAFQLAGFQFDRIQKYLARDDVPTALKIKVEELRNSVADIIEGKDLLDGDDFSQLSKVFIRFSKSLERSPIRDTGVNKMFVSLSNNLAGPMLDITLLPSKNMKAKIRAQYAKLRKRAEKEWKYAKTHKIEAAKKIYKYAKRAAVLYGTYRMTMSAKQQRLGRLHQDIMADWGKVTKFGKSLREEKSLKGAFKKTFFKTTVNLDSNTTFDDIIGQKVAKQKFLDILERSKSKTDRTNMTRGILLIGPPGVGKTLMVSAFVNTAEMSAYVVSGPSIESAWELKYWYFKPAYKKAPSVIFIDEIEKMPDQVKKALLTLIDGAEFPKDKTVIVIGAANYRAQLDDALLRRFDAVIEMTLPPEQDRIELIDYYLNKILKKTNYSKAKDVDDKLIEFMATLTDGFSSANIRALVANAIRNAFRSRIVTRDHLITETYNKLLEKLEEKLFSDKYKTSGEIRKKLLEKHLGHKEPEKASQMQDAETVEKELKAAFEKLEK